MARTAIQVTSYDHVKKPVGQGRYLASCAALVQHFGCHVTSEWRKGSPVKGNSIIKKGTCIATFEGDRYPNRSSGNHAAIFVSQSKKGIVVFDQWVGRKPGLRLIPFKKDMSDPSNNGNCFSVILTPVFSAAKGIKYAKQISDPKPPKKKRYQIESLIKDKTVAAALRKALANDGKISYAEVKALILSTMDGKITRHELADMQTILENSKSIDGQSKALIREFLKSPYSVAKSI